MEYNKQNYAGPSGVNMEELLEIQRLLTGEAATPGQPLPQAAILALVLHAQETRRRSGLPLVASASRMIQELTVVFGLMS